MKAVKTLAEIIMGIIMITMIGLCLITIVIFV